MYPNPWADALELPDLAHPVGAHSALSWWFHGLAFDNAELTSGIDTRGWAKLPVYVERGL